MTHPSTTITDWTADPRFGTDDHPVGTLAELDALCARRIAEVVGPIGPELHGQIFRYERDTHRRGLLTGEWEHFEGALNDDMIDAVLGPDWLDPVNAEGECLYDVEISPHSHDGVCAADAHPWTLLRDEVSLADLLAEPDSAAPWRITGMWPSGGKVVLSAPAKAGKSTLLGNLIRSLVDGDPFLGPSTAGAAGVIGEVGGFTVTPLDPGECVWLADIELSRDQLRRWLGDQGIRNTDRVHVELFRGRADALDVRDPAVRAALAGRLRALNVRVILVDPAAPILAVLGVDDMRNGPTRAYLDALAALAQDVGNAELLVAHHAGHDGERSRGASAWRDWPDAEWRLTVARPGNGRQAAADAPRFLAASGRDVTLAEVALAYDTAHRRLTLATGDRQTAMVDKHAAILLGLVAAHPGLSRNQITDRARDDHGVAQGAARDALRSLVAHGEVHHHGGPNRSHLHHAGAACSSCLGEEESASVRPLRAVP